MLKVFKYEIAKPHDYIEVEMRKGAQILKIDEQQGKVCLWALVDPSMPNEIRRFRFAGTGHPINEFPEQLKFINTFQMRGGALVFHLFEVVYC